MKSVLPEDDTRIRPDTCLIQVGPVLLLSRPSIKCIVNLEKGWCKSGNDCRFTHGTSDKRKLVGDGVEGALGKPATIREPCKFFAKGQPHFELHLRLCIG